MPRGSGLLEADFNFSDEGWTVGADHYNPNNVNTVGHKL
jgi:hypothetical protein